ncbi:MAG: hypothetical protein M1833_001651 [Piccolia ochrophora]|nr:MAG: hypothetical protein M1833_001651 [Piccolia ochrophora]
MNNIREIQALNRREIENGVSPEASWHADYRDTAYVYVGGLPFELSEGDIITIFSQFGEPVYVNLVRDKDTGKSRGFAFLKYEDQRSTDLAVDNLGGTTVMGRTLRVDHTRYKKKDDEEVTDNTNGFSGVKDDKDDPDQGRRNDDSESEQVARPLLNEEQELMALMRDHDDDDPMKQYMIKEKREEVETALAAMELKKKKKEHRDPGRHQHRHHRHRVTKNDAANGDMSIVLVILDHGIGTYPATGTKRGTVIAVVAAPRKEAAHARLEGIDVDPTTRMYQSVTSVPSEKSGDTAARNHESDINIDLAAKTAEL